MCYPGKKLYIQVDCCSLSGRLVGWYLIRGRWVAVGKAILAVVLQVILWDLTYTVDRRSDN